LNLTILDAKAAVKAKVLNKIQERQAKRHVKAPKFVQTRVANRLASVASAVVKPHKIAEMLGPRLEKLLPYLLREKGITVAVDMVFIEDTYVVWELQVQHVDMDVLVEVANNRKNNEGKSEENEVDYMDISESQLDEMIAEQSERLSEEEYWKKTDRKKKSEKDPLNTTNNSSGLSILGCIGWFFECLFGKTKIENKHMPALVASKMLSVMDDVVKAKLEKKELVADSIALPEEEQARFFYAHLNSLSCPDDGEKSAKVIT